MTRSKVSLSVYTKAAPVSPVAPFLNAIDPDLDAADVTKIVEGSGFPPVDTLNTSSSACPTPFGPTTKSPVLLNVPTLLPRELDRQSSGPPPWPCRFATGPVLLFLTLNAVVPADSDPALLTYRTSLAEGS